MCIVAMELHLHAYDHKLNRYSAGNIPLHTGTLSGLLVVGL